MERKGKVIPCRWTENRKGTGTNSGESGVRNLEAGSIRNGVESMGGCVKLKTVTELTWSRECLSCTEFFVGLEASGEIETEVLCGQFYVFFSMWRAAQFCVQRRLWTEEAGRPERRELQ